MTQNILPAVAAVIFNDANQVLLQRRRDTGRWCIISGHVEFGESVEEGMVREIMEEINTPAKIVRLIGIYSSPQYQIYDYGNTKTQYVVACFEVKLTQSIPTDFFNNETLELRYFNINKLPPDMDQIHPRWLTDALDQNDKAFIR